MKALLLAAVTVVCVSTEPIKNGYAKVIVLGGQVSVMRDGVPIALFENNFVKHQEMIVTGADGYAKFEVCDGSFFEVFNNSKVVFNDNPTTTFKDLLNVWIGHIKVIINHLNGPNYNSVTTPTAVISVRGTIFDVDVEDEDGTTVVAVDEGKVQVRNVTVAGGSEPMLLPGDAIRIYRGRLLLAKLVDHTGQTRAILNHALDLMRVLAQRGGGVGLPGTGGGLPGTTGAQGDKGKNTGGSGTGASTGSGSGSKGAPPAGPPAGPGGH